jgi:2,3-bisphosphoglycerate-independent phosphoglycerate mutase
MKRDRPRPLVLIILDGWGHRESTDDNAIYSANKPNWDHMLMKYPNTLISGSGKCVGLPSGQMGNSEVGHLNMGAGRIVYQDFTRIDLAIDNGEFFTNPVFINAFTQAKETNKAVHIMGLLSPGGVHSHERHIHAMIDLAAKLNHRTPLYIHAFLDGRDTPPKDALVSLKALDRHCEQSKCGRIVSLIGRYYAMDRDKRWERAHLAYDLLVLGKAAHSAKSAEEGLEQAYLRSETDEFVKPTTIYQPHGRPITIQDGDVVIFMNFRADRARELTSAFIDPDFHGFTRGRWPKLGKFVCLTQYDERFSTQAEVAYPPAPLQHIFAECLGRLNLKQLRIAETEKYAHVTFFFNGGVETPYPGEDRILIPSPAVATYDLQPEMSAKALTERLVNEIHGQKYDVIICNFANPDMVGHTGNFAATVKAIETVDQCLGKIIKAAHDVGGEIIITADHGNAEKMYDPKTNQPHTAHTSDPVPFIYVGRKAEIINKNGKLSDIAPTMLYLLNIEKPKEMTGNSLLELTELN